MKQLLQGLKPYQPGKQIDEVKRELGLSEVVKLASNENPFGCSKLAIEAITQAATDLAIYPDGYATDLRAEVAEFLGVEQNQLTFGNGTDEVISIISRSYLEPGANTIMATPTFPQYKHNAILEGAESREVPLLEGRHDLDAMLEEVDENTRIIWLCNPNNPSGEYIRENELLSFLDKVPDDVLVVLDEAYYEYVSVDDYPDSLSLIKKHPNLLFTRTFSKIYGLAGLRVGYAVGAPAVIKIMEAVREPFNSSRVAQAAAKAAIADQDFIQYCHDKNREGLKQFYDFCVTKGLKYYPSQGNFILIDVNEPGDNVFQYLLKNGYIVRSGQALGYPTGIRITVGDKEQNEAIIQLLGDYFS